MDREDVATLDREFVGEALGEPAALSGGLAVAVLDGLARIGFNRRGLLDIHGLVQARLAIAA